MNERVMTLPATAEEALEELEGIGQLMYLKGWRKAALVWCLTTNEGAGRPKKSGNTTGYSMEAFAKLGITGLKSDKTVRLYRQRWEEYGDTSIKLGDSIVIPSDDFPPNGGNEGSRISNDPEKAVEQVVEKHGEQSVAKAIAKDTSLTAKIAGEMQPDPSPSSSGQGEGELLGTLSAMEAMSDYAGLTMKLADAFAAVAPFIRSGTIPLAEELLQGWDDRLELELIMIRQLKADILETT